jgi:hypothetical protein
MSGGYAVASTAKISRIHASNRIRSTAKLKPMKLTIKQKIRNWLMNDDADDYSHSITIDDSGPNIQSQGFRLNVYGASGGTIVETTKYDRNHDENRNSLHVITEDKDLGEELSKIITMEQLR